jgi:hypothetical protein
MRLEILQECYKVRDPGYDLKADHGFYTVVLPPRGSAKVVVPGMDPELIKDPAARRRYREDIEENNRRREKYVRERDLQRVLDAGAHCLEVSLRNRPQGSQSRKDFFAILNGVLTNGTYRDAVLKNLSQSTNSTRQP